MSGEDVKARAGVATGTGAAGEPETAVATGPSRGAKYAGPAEEVRRVVIVPVPPESAAPVIRRGPGRPPMTRETFWRKYRVAVASLGPDATEVEIATGAVFLWTDARPLQRRIALFGLPPEMVE